MGSSDIHEQVVPVPDDRLDWLTGLYDPKKTTYATIDCVDVPGFSFLDDHGRAAARRRFNDIRTVDMFVLVIRAFENASVPAYRDSINPARDLDELKTEMLLADLEMVTTRIDRLEKQVNKPSKTQARDKQELELQYKLQEAIESEKPISSVIENSMQMDLIKPLNFLTLKPILIVINAGEDLLGETISLKNVEGLQVIQLSVAIESELAQLAPQSRAEFMKDMGLQAPASKQFFQSGYSALGLISFLTAGKDEVRAWPIERAHPPSTLPARFIQTSNAALSGQKRWPIRICRN
jgi:ribosome-binding ATPase YchF (GTP1/OBG family)